MEALRFRLFLALGSLSTLLTSAPVTFGMVFRSETLFLLNLLELENNSMSPG